MEEIIFYQSGPISVTQSRFIVENKTFAVRNISSVQIGIIPANRTLGIILIIGGVLLCFAQEARIFGIVLTILGGIYTYLQKDKYTVRISINSGETDSLWSKDRQFIQKIVNALNEAIIHRG
jgi:hypothetical protein